jgi:hypothetical protein
MRSRKSTLHGTARQAEGKLIPENSPLRIAQ